jgi:hypothetical protein
LTIVCDVRREALVEHGADAKFPHLLLALADCPKAVKA